MNNTFAVQLAALLSARRAISASSRRESPASWWTKRLLFAGIAAAMCFGTFMLGVVLPNDQELDHERIAMLFLLGPFAAAGYLIVLQMRDGPGAHPLGDARRLLPLSRRRSAALRLAEETANPGTLFVAAYALSPLLGIVAGGGNWLNGWGWLSIVLLIAAAMGWKEGISAFQAWLLEAASGATAALSRLGFTFVIILMPVLFQQVANLFGFGDFDLFGLDGLPFVNSARGTALIAASTSVLFGAALWVRTWPGWRLALPWSSGRPARAPRPVRFVRGSIPLAMLQLMALRAYRIPAFRYSLALLALFGFMLSWLPPSSGAPLLIIAGFLSPLAMFFNIYGQDAAYYALWLASGRTLHQWTLARLTFATVNLALFSYIALTILSVAGVPPSGWTPALTAVPVLAAALGITLGPVVSRYTLTASVTEVGSRARTSVSARSFVPGVGAALVAGIATGTVIGMIVSDIGWLAWPLALTALAGSMALSLEGAAWSPHFRLRLANSFRG